MDPSTSQRGRCPSRLSTHLKKEVTTQGVLQLNATPSKTKVKAKRPSKGMAKHNRLVKQEARKASIPGNDVNKRKRPAA